MLSASERPDLGKLSLYDLRYGRGVHKKVHSKAKTLGRAYALVWQTYRQRLDRTDDVDKDDQVLMAFHAKLYKD